MTFRLIPRDVKFLDLFAASGQNLLQAAVKLRDLVTNFDRLDDRIAEIQVLEKEGDRIDRQIGARLEESFIAPFDREDIHDLTTRLDDVVDFIQAVAESLAIYDVRQPTNEAHLLAGLLASQAMELSRGAGQARVDEGPDRALEPHPRARASGRWHIAGRNRAALPRVPRPAGGHQMARDLPLVGERH